jgi:anti-anti-sigma regulatory factor
MLEQETGRDHVLIALGKSFTFRDYRGFRSGYEGKPTKSRFVVDMRETEYIDSSGLGMLLILKDYAVGGSVELRNAGAAVQRILSMAHFDRLFPLGK